MSTKNLDTMLARYDELRRMTKSQLLDLLCEGPGVRPSRSGLNSEFLKSDLPEIVMRHEFSARACDRFFGEGVQS